PGLPGAARPPTMRMRARPTPGGPGGGRARGPSRPMTAVSSPAIPPTASRRRSTVMSLTLDPEVAQALAPMAAPIADQTPPPVGDALTRRTVQDHLIAEAGHGLPVPDDVAMTDYHATAPDGAQIPMRWYAKKVPAPGAAVLYTHGGGMILGSMDLYDRPLARYVSASGNPMLSVDYRLAPEHRYPTQVQDAYAGLRWLDEHAKELG